MKTATKLILTSTVMLPVLLGSCGKTGEPHHTSTWTVKTNNLYVPDDSSKEVTFQADCQYSFALDLVNNNIVVNASDIKIDGSSHSFTSNPFPMQYSIYGQMWTAYFENGASAATSASGATGISGYLTNIVKYYQPTNEVIPGRVVSPQPVMAYRLGNHTVYTFASNSYFTGETVTTYPSQGGMKNFVNKEPIYRVSFSSDMKKADLVIYNACFAQEMMDKGMMLKAVYLRGLDVELNGGGYKITGKDVIPEVLEDTTTTPYGQFTFNSIVVRTIPGNMTRIDCEYVCASVFRGAFSGSSVDVVNKAE